MRITFMGSMIPLPVRRAQAEMSIFVEVGWKPDPSDAFYRGRALDQFVFDCGAGVSANYAAAVVGFRRMDKVFINHLHGDHMNDLTHIYYFGPAGDRKSPLYVFGPGPSGVESPPAGSKIYYDDGTSNFCAMARAAWRWHSESFSFQPTHYTNCVIPTRESWGLPVDPVPVSDCTNIVFGTNIVWSFDLMVLRVFPDRIEQRRAVVSDYAFNPPVQLPSGGLYLPKYNDGTNGNPFAQIDLSSQIPATNDNGTINYRSDGY